MDLLKIADNTSFPLNRTTAPHHPELKSSSLPWLPRSQVIWPCLAPSSTPLSFFPLLCSSHTHLLSAPRTPSSFLLNNLCTDALSLYLVWFLAIQQNYHPRALPTHWSSSSSHIEHPILIITNCYFSYWWSSVSLTNGVLQESKTLPVFLLLLSARNRVLALLYVLNEWMRNND